MYPGLAISLHVYSAGVTDSALTIHGSLQAERLAKYFAETGVRFNYIFSSDLQRTYKTANAIYLAQPKGNEEERDHSSEVIALSVLREQDFGYYEGKPLYARPRDSSKTGKEDHRAEHRGDPAFKDVESKESMAVRTHTFLKERLVPIIQMEAQHDNSAVAIVSHGILLSHLWRSFLQLLPKNSVALSPGLSVGNDGMTPLEYLGGWSNTGFLELILQKTKNALTEQRQPPSPSSSPLSEFSHLKPSRPDVPLQSLGDFKMIITTVNGKHHLNGLKRTRGGVGSSKHDESQKTIESFFKKRKV